VRVKRLLFRGFSGDYPRRPSGVFPGDDGKALQGMKSTILFQGTPSSLADIEKRLSEEMHMLFLLISVVIIINASWDFFSDEEVRYDAPKFASD
jgi:hypothetical protein